MRADLLNLWECLVAGACEKMGKKAKKKHKEELPDATEAEQTQLSALLLFLRSCSPQLKKLLAFAQEPSKCSVGSSASKVHSSEVPVKAKPSPQDKEVGWLEL